MAIANANKTIVGVFNSVSEAHQAVRELEGQGIPRSDISIVANKNAAGYDTIERTDKAADVVADAGIGAAIGGVGGLLLSAAGAITIPVIGPVLAAGPIAAALTGAGIGAAAGGLVGALTESGVPEEHAKYYAEGVRRGDVLVTVKTRDENADRVCDILDRHNAIDVDDRVSDWKGRGWSGYRTDATPMSDEELRQERERYRTHTGPAGEYMGTSGTMGTTGMTGAGLNTPNYPATGTTDYPGATGYDLGESTHDRIREAGRDVKDWGREVKHDTDRGWHNMTDRDRDGRSNIGESAREAGRDVKEWGEDMADKVRRGTHRVGEEMRELRDEARDNERRMENSYSQDLPTSTEYRRRRARVYDHIKS